MTSTVPVSVQDRLGLPDTTGRRRLVGAHLVDSLGTGLLLAFTVLYFTRTTGLGVAAVGAAVTLARLLALPTAILTGPLIDRFGARQVAACGNALSALAYGGFLAARQAWQIVLVCLLAQAGAVAYWTSSTGLVVLAAAGGERTRWFALVQTLRNAGLGIGGALGSLVVAGSGTGGLRLLVLLNALSYAAATVLLARWRPAGTPGAAAPARPGAPAGGYRRVLRDGRYVLLVGINLCSVFGSMIISMLLAVYLTEGLHQQAWVAGSLLVMNGVQVVLTQSVVARRLERFRPTRVLAAASLVNAVAFALFALMASAPGWAVLAGLHAAMFLFNAAETMATPFAEDLSVSLADPALRGRYLAVYQLSWNTGQALAPGLLTLLLVRGTLWPWAFLAALAVAAVPALLLLERMVAPAGRLVAPAGAS
ncbi:MFS transporter [Kitasatospora indigofera]|uniref:MFS transporter n=1 Tax=Kitasatospora indigofera TaxID=67307 RepID=A0A919FCN6_9ACTN|nr:MFS transporter [Kitasatospora indigofera]GHH60856.1 MFS transporter [Kitasatospora indigofera]